MPSSPGPASRASRSTRDARILVVEDDPTVLEVADTYLRAAGHLVDTATDGFAALAIMDETPPDLVVLDRMLPGIDGVEVCRRIRAKSGVPVIILTALGSTENRIEGLEAGADDYVSKPFSPRELVLRVESVLRRSVADSDPEVPFVLGPFAVDVSARSITMHGTPLVLPAREFALLVFLLKHPGRVFDRDTLLREVWGWEFGDSSTITVTVRRIRERIEVDASNPEILTTVWGVGYRLATP